MFAYGERACLIQVSTATQDIIIDPLADLDLLELGRLISEPSVEKVLHAAEYDLILLRRDYGWHLHNLFDTMWAARILGYAQIGLASLLERFFGVSLSKRYQKADWCRRPLSADELAYAQKDTHYLLALRDRLAAELHEHGHDEEAEEIFREQTRVRLPDNGFDPDGFWYLNGVFDMSSRGQAALRGLYLFRDREARRRDVPHFKVMSDKTLLEIASALPDGWDALDTLHTLSPGQRARYGRRILELVAQSSDAAPPQPPQRAPRPPDAVLNRYERLHTWRKHRAQRRGVESDVIMSREALWAIAQANPHTVDDLIALNVLGPWRLRTYGEEVLHLLHRRRAPLQ